MTVPWPQPGPNNAACTTPDQSDTHIPLHQFKSSHMWALALSFAIWKFMKAGDQCCKTRTITSTWRLSANDSYFSTNFRHSIFLKFFWLLLIFLELGNLLLLGMLPLVFTLHGQWIVFHFLHNVATHVTSPRSRAASTGSLSHPHLHSSP